MNSMPTYDQRFSAVFDSLCELGRTYYESGRSSEAGRLLQAGFQLAELSGEPRHRLQLLLAEGKRLTVEFVSANADAPRMFDVLLEARQLAEDAGDRFSLANALSLLGIAHYFAELNASSTVAGGHEAYREALGFQRQALDLREALDDRRGLSESLFNIGVVYERRQKPDRAVAYYRKAFEIAERSGFAVEMTEPVRHFAYHALIGGDLEQALRYGQQALELRQASGFLPYLPLDHLLLCDIYLRSENIAKAQAHADKAMQLADDMRNKRAAASSLLSLGEIHLMRNEKEQALEKFERAALLAQELKLPLLVARSNERLAKLQ